MNLRNIKYVPLSALNSILMKIFMNNDEQKIAFSILAIFRDTDLMIHPQGQKKW